MLCLDDKLFEQIKERAGDDSTTIASYIRNAVAKWMQVENQIVNNAKAKYDVGQK